MFIGGLLAWLFLKNKDGENQLRLNLRIAELDKDKSVLADRVQQSVLQNESVRAQNEKERL